jgi:predicted DNA-binding protein
MATQVTITLPDELYERAESLARRTSRELAEILTETLARSLGTPDWQGLAALTVEDLSDEEVLAITNLTLPSKQDRRFSKLLDKQQAGKLVPSERAELLAFMQIYQQGLLLKAQALREAVQRGLLPPLEP